MGMFQVLQSGEDMGQMQSVWGWPGNQKIGTRENDMVFAIAAPNGRALAVMGAYLPDVVPLFLEGIELPHIQGIADSCLSDMRWLGTKMRAQAFNLVCDLSGF